MAWQILYRRNGHWLPGKTHQQKKDATEQAPAQDEREAFEAWMVEVEGARIRPRFDRVTAGPFADEYRDGQIQGAWNVWQARAARPTQTEQQPVAYACRLRQSQG